MAPKSLQDAAVATNAELDDMAKTYGLFETAQATGMGNWISDRKSAVLRQIHKTRSELRRLEQSLARLETLTQTQFGRDNGVPKFYSEYVPLEGWSLTLMANYVALAAYGDEYQREQRFTRAIKYTQGAMQFARSHPRTGAQLQKPVLDALQDQAVIFR